VHFLVLESLKAKQLPAVVELDQLCFSKLWTLEGYSREMNSPNSELLVLSVPNFQNNISTSLDQTQKIIGIGCLWAILEEAHLTILGIHPDYRGQGLGRLLLTALLTKAVQRKLERATLEVRDSNVSALSLYEKFGFKIAGKRKRYYSNPPEDALILWRSGLNSPPFVEELATWHSQISHRLRQSSWDLQDPELILSLVNG